ncbi:MAG: hypothetical protein CL431_01810 [Acidimicrobiaceae bacterium]|nr:hypothetical protein [Acidimicrobiaceae bacterium]|tara:strand:- start:135838 stop:136461 length:624 start_codon:yes stop_codon:yes gene_type:complete
MQRLYCLIMVSNAHYFEQDPSSDQVEGSVQLSLPDFSTTLRTSNNVFSWKRVDPGTKFLLLNAPIPDSQPKNILDLGCGYGPITAYLEHRFSTTKVWGIDVNNRAIELAKTNMQQENTVICKPDEVPDDVNFDLIYSNPPVRIGKHNLKKLLTTWLNRLNPLGSAHLVINKNLGADSIQKWLETEAWMTHRLKSVSGYRILEVKHRV